MKYISLTHIPTILSVSRVIFSPLLLAPLLVWAGSTDYSLLWGSTILVMLGLYATGVMEWYLAYAYQLESSYGALLKPIGDMFWYISVIVGLLATGRIAWGWVLLFLCRDFFVMNLCLAAEQKNIHVPTSYLAVAKKIVIAVALILLAIKQWALLHTVRLASGLADISFAFLLIAGFLSVITAFFYAHHFFQMLSKSSIDES